ncbi:hypothetical protein PHYSODRAFT_515963 [Phytophthora sojae]|uniref:Uncharacterized protein n=1 Tax=Phytophthora sojae (strain P6497) TaxID=1094619 RepID=G4ZX27_PHYSP|nr:hypothetical protein PHYSODRAFT_515963 [Phytophthora sojae]EGZ12497.1 hypothetical protein PHYSODRAFT_515963 [Phytophthora sojae]|eukprot:XP_009532830.1 hypothetical protein PHYSODRAFT_515963 [Phytophthora sojae]
MVKTVLLSPSALRQFNRIATRLNPFLGILGIVGLSARIATFASPVSVGCILAPISVFLQILGLVLALSHMRTGYMKILVCTFDFWFLETANTLWATTFCAVLNDSRVVLVLFCWVDFTFWLLEEAYLRNSRMIVGVAFMQWTFYVLLTVLLSLELVDGVQHYELITTGGRTLSTNDVLVNSLVTMTMLSLRNVYRRYRHLKQQKSKQRVSEMNRYTKRPLLQMVLAAESFRVDPRDTVWPRIGALTPLSAWQLIAVHVCGTIGGVFGALSIFLPRSATGAPVSAVGGLIASAIYCGVHTCCSQRQLLKRVLASFHFLFLELQIIAAGLCVADMFGWSWIPTCGMASSLLLGFPIGFPILACDALTPVMKHRLRYKHWIIINGIVSYVSIQVVILLDALTWGNMELRDRVIFDFTYLGRQAKFCVVPFYLSRIVTITIWTARNGFVALTRPDDSALIMLRGEVEFDYEGWKKQFNLGPRLG